jgi:hypothetical protein
MTWAGDLSVGGFELISFNVRSPIPDGCVRSVHRFQCLPPARARRCFSKIARMASLEFESLKSKDSFSKDLSFRCSKDSPPKDPSVRANAQAPVGQAATAHGREVASSWSCGSRSASQSTPKDRAHGVARAGPRVGLSKCPPRRRFTGARRSEPTAGARRKRSIGRGISILPQGNYVPGSVPIVRVRLSAKRDRRSRRRYLRLVQRRSAAWQTDSCPREINRYRSLAQRGWRRRSIARRSDACRDPGPRRLRIWLPFRPKDCPLRRCRPCSRCAARGRIRSRCA